MKAELQRKSGEHVKTVDIPPDMIDTPRVILDVETAAVYVYRKTSSGYVFIEDVFLKV